jgi:hypothetical protein
MIRGRGFFSVRSGRGLLCGGTESRNLPGVYYQSFPVRKFPVREVFAEDRKPSRIDKFQKFRPPQKKKENS